MRLTFQIEGGLAVFPGLSKPRVIDTAELEPQDASALERLVSESQFWTWSEPPVTATRARDARSYALEIEADGHKKRVRFSDPVPQQFAALLDDLQKRLRQPPA